jgi:SAM-dependent methyltransferase
MTEAVERTAAGERWRAMVRAHQAQSQRLRDPDWHAGLDYAPPSVDSFRADRERADDARVLEVLRSLTQPPDVVVDVGAGAGRFAIPLARRVHEVVAVEPSAAMRTTLAADVERAGVTNVRVVPQRWDEVSDVAGDLVFAAHVVYPLEDIEPFVRHLDAAARRWAAVLVFEAPPLSWLFPFWPAVHAEARLPPPHLPQVVDVVTELGFGPLSIDRIDVEPFELGPPELARTKLRRRLYVAPGSAADQRLAGAMADLLDDRAGLLVPRTERPIRVGIVRWQPQHRG